MRKKQRRYFSLWGLVFLPILGCVNPYRANFNPTRDRFPNWVESRVGKGSGKTRLVTTNDIKSENWRQFEQGYIMIGFSKFDGPEADTSLALRQAESIGADVVLIEKKFSKSLTETVTVTQWAPSETTEVRENTHVQGSRGDKWVDQRTEVTTSRGPETVYVPKQVDYYQHSVTYWRKIEKPLFGAFVVDPSDALKQKLQSNHALVVRAVMVDSPAHEADLLKEDVLLKINGNPVPSAQKFYESLSTLAGKKLMLTVMRGDKTFERPIQLNP